MIYSPAEILVDEDGNPIGVDGNPLKIDTTGTTTQPVSAAALPLPTGAATEAKQPALGVAGTPSADVITVQGHAGMTAVVVDGSAVTQPVSGSVSVSNFPATQPVSGSVSVSNFPATQPVSATTLPLPTGAATSANQITLGSQTTKINDGTNTAAVKPASTAAIATDPALVVAISPNNALPVTSSVIKAANSAVTRVPAATSSTTLSAANSNRLNIIIVNDGTNNLYIKFGTGASTTSYTYYVTSHGTFEMQIPVVYTGIITGLWSTATGGALITELTA
jgi:hypothetical protein